MLIEGRHVPTVLGSASTQGRRKKSGKTPRSPRRSRKSERKSPEKVKVNTNIRAHKVLYNYIICTQ